VVLKEFLSAKDAKDAKKSQSTTQFSFAHFRVLCVLRGQKAFANHPADVAVAG
jgi:hypothetical protein